MISFFKTWEENYKIMQIEQIDSLYYQGNALYNSEKFDEAIKYYDKIIEINPDSKIAWGYKAHIISKLK